MTAGLATFAKVRALHDSTTIPGEKASAAARMKELARKAGMTVDQALSKLDEPPVTIVASATVDMNDAFNAFFNTPEKRAERAAREVERQAKAAAIIERLGSLDAVYADTPMEAALRAACEPLLGPGETWSTIYRLDGWDSLSPTRAMPATVRAAVSEAWLLPSTVAEAWAEHEATEARIRDRYTVDAYCDPEAFVTARQSIVAALLDTLPARGLKDVRARLLWLEFWPGIEVQQNAGSHRATLATLRADIERMGQRIREQDAEATGPHQEGLSDRVDKIDPASGVQSGQVEGVQDHHPPLTPCQATAQNCAQGSPQSGHPSDLRGKPAPVQNGQGEGVADRDPLLTPCRATVEKSTAGYSRSEYHSRRTNADKRRDVLALLGQGLTDREIARRAGVSPSTVGNIRKGQP